MKYFWSCLWEVTPGNGEEILCFPTLEEAKLAMRRKITEHIDLSDFFDKLQPEAAQFLDKYLSDPCFPQREEECPNIFDDLEEQDEICGEVILNAGCVYLKYDCGLAPVLSTNIVLDEPDDDYRLDFWYDGLWKKTHNGISGMSIRIRQAVDYGKSAYPVLVLLALREKPATQRELIDRVATHWDTRMDRKAVGRHLKLLEDMGFPVRHNEKGYWYGGERTQPKFNLKYTSSAYPLMVLETLDDTPRTFAAIAQEIYNKYGVVVERKAISRHLALLRELGFTITREKGGHVIKF